ncbi:MFS transporter [Microbacterium sp. STN6]|uniref:MFS transporter n=1 Tax=Microbacterium sp. STN6 TaxID=2995588 RepID=UPI002260C975|nr:MFS transporter [Microbacterium sp. STN6]MCX7521477.1 MFS transporter [Microbacterium sp. STN6]
MTEHRRIGVAVASLSLGTALNPLNSSMIAVALVQLRDDFDLTVVQVTWVITCFYLASAALQPVIGRMADRFGPRRLFVSGMAVVAVTCVLAPFSPTFALVCVSRVFMAVGTATAFPCAVAMVTTLSRQAQVSSTRPLGAMQMANTTGAALGPVIGGLLVSFVGWQALFFLNVPLALLSLVAVARFAPADPPRVAERMAVTLRDSDVPGILAFTVALVAGLIAVLGALPALTWWMAGLAVVSGALFVWRELRFDSPFLDLALLVRNRSLMIVYLSVAVFNAVYYCAFFGLPQLFEEAGGYDAGIVGLLMLPLAAMSAFLTPVAARSIDRWGVRPVLMVGTVGLVAASALLWLFTATIGVLVVLLLVAAMGVPYCAFSIASSQGMYASARAEDRGVAAGIYQTSRYFGAISATTIIGVAFGSSVTTAQWGSMVPIMAALAVVTVVLSAVWRPAGRV